MRTKKLQKMFIPILLLLTVAFMLPEKPTVYMAGDSTMAIKREDRRPETGWGEMISQFFNDKITFDNRARNGRSTRTFIEEGRWDTLVNSLKEGDFVFIQFGHNDESKKKIKRYTSPDDFKKNLIKFVTDTREKNATPILLTPVMRRRFDENGKFYDVHGVYPDKVREVAKELKVDLIDQHRLSEAIIVQYGEEKSKQLFLHIAPEENENYPDGLVDNTHFSPLGAKLMAEQVALTIKKKNIELSKYVEM